MNSVRAADPLPRPPFRVLRVAGAVSLRVRTRSVLVCALVIAAVVVVGVVTLSTGDYRIPPADVVRALLGRGDSATHFVVVSLRLPRLVTGILVGGALGVSGAIFQSLTGNPLGSPDVIGFGTGSATGALAVIVLAHGGAVAVSGGAVAGGLLTAAVVYLLAVRGGAIHGFRLILVGIGTTGMLVAFNQWMMIRATLNDAVSVQIWLTGSLNGRGWEQAVPLALALSVLLPSAFSLSRCADVLEMGDDTAKTLGLRVERGRLALVGLAVALVAVATAAAGPVTFVALAAPQIARRLTGTPGVGMAPAAAMGALIVAASDLVAQRALSSELPVGVATAVVGGIYLAFLLGRRWRSRD